MMGRGTASRGTAGPSVRVLVPPARGARGFTRERRTFAAIVTGTDRRRTGVEAFRGPRVRGAIEAKAGALLLVYGEDRAPFTGELRGHRADLYRVLPIGTVRRLASVTTDAGDDWTPAMLAAIDRARRPPPRRRGEVVPLTRPHPSVVLVLVAVLALLAGSTSPARADVRDTAAWSVELRAGEWATLPAYVCDGALPSDREAWSARTGRRVGDARLWEGSRPVRIVGSAYRGPVLAFVWCDRDDADEAAARWAMVKLRALAAQRSGRAAT